MNKLKRTVAFLLVSVLLFQDIAYASSDLTTRKNEIENKIGNVENEISTVKSKQTSLVSQMNELSKNMAEVDAEIAKIDGQDVYSNELNYDLICYKKGNTTPIIASAFDTSVEQEQYTSFVIRYRVYTPGKNNSTVYLYTDGIKMKTVIKMLMLRLCVKRAQI